MVESPMKKYYKRCFSSSTPVLILSVHSEYFGTPGIILMVGGSMLRHRERYEAELWLERRASFSESVISSLERLFVENKDSISFRMGQQKGK